MTPPGVGVMFRILPHRYLDPQSVTTNPIPITRSDRNPPPAPHIRSSGPNNQAITNPRLTMLKQN